MVEQTTPKGNKAGSWSDHELASEPSYYLYLCH